jgi:hypothetical protein
LQPDSIREQPKFADNDKDWTSFGYFIYGRALSGTSSLRRVKRMLKPRAHSSGRRGLLAHQPGGEPRAGPVAIPRANRSPRHGRRSVSPRFVEVSTGDKTSVLKPVVAPKVAHRLSPPSSTLSSLSINALMRWINDQNNLAMHMASALRQPQSRPEATTALLRSTRSLLFAKRCRSLAAVLAVSQGRITGPLACL